MNSQNIGAYVTTRFALESTPFGVGVGNLAATDGEEFQRTSVRPLHLSGKLVTLVAATLPSGSSLTLVTKMREKDAGGAYADMPAATGGGGVPSKTTVIEAIHDGSEQKVTVEVDFNLIGAKEYIQPQFTGTLTASGSSVVTISAGLVLGGGETLPPTEAPA